MARVGSQRHKKKWKKKKIIVIITIVVIIIIVKIIVFSVCKLISLRRMHCVRSKIEVKVEQMHKFINLRFIIVVAYVFSLYPTLFIKFYVTLRYDDVCSLIMHRHLNNISSFSVAKFLALKCY
jgi:hypothetical protein